MTEELWMPQLYDEAFDLVIVHLKVQLRLVITTPQGEANQPVISFHDSPDLDSPAKLDNSRHVVAQYLDKVFMGLPDLFCPEVKKVLRGIAAKDTVKHERIHRRKPTLVHQVNRGASRVVHYLEVRIGDKEGRV